MCSYGFEIIDEILGEDTEGMESGKWRMENELRKLQVMSHEVAKEYLRLECWEWMYPIQI